MARLKRFLAEGLRQIHERDVCVDRLRVRALMVPDVRVLVLAALSVWALVLKRRLLSEEVRLRLLAAREGETGLLVLLLHFVLAGRLGRRLSSAVLLARRSEERV